MNTKVWKMIRCLTGKQGRNITVGVNLEAPVTKHSKKLFGYSGAL